MSCTSSIQIQTSLRKCTDTEHSTCCCVYVLLHELGQSRGLGQLAHRPLAGVKPVHLQQRRVEDEHQLLERLVRRLQRLLHTEAGAKIA